MKGYFFPIKTALFVTTQPTVYCFVLKYATVLFVYTIRKSRLSLYFYLVSRKVLTNNVKLQQPAKMVKVNITRGWCKKWLTSLFFEFLTGSIVCSTLDIFCFSNFSIFHHGSPTKDALKHPIYKTCFDFALLSIEMIHHFQIWPKQSWTGSLRECPFYTWYRESSFGKWISMRNCVLKMPQTAIVFKITSVILAMLK